MIRYSGAGNSFVIIDGRNLEIRRFTKPQVVHRICLLNNVDGLMILTNEPGCDFGMLYFNRDGSGGMMCGNGGRCITACAEYLNIRPSGKVPGNPEAYLFKAPDGLHEAQILERNGDLKIVRLKMKDVCEVHKVSLPGADGTGSGSGGTGVGSGYDGWFLDTGTRHFVKFSSDAAVEEEGRAIRNMPQFAPQGVNVDFACFSPDGNSVSVRTYEKGVEAETLSCGTGVVATAIAAYMERTCLGPSGACHCDVITRTDRMSVDFVPVLEGFVDEARLTQGEVQSPRFEQVYLTGPTLFEGELD